MISGFGVTVRALRRRPLFTAVTVATLSLGIGATTAVYSFVDGILLSPLAYRQPDRLMTVQFVIPELRERYPTLPVNVRAIDAWQRGCEESCRQLAALSPARVITSTWGEPERLDGARVSPGFFELLGIEPLLGRVFDADEPGQVVVLTHGLWQRRYGGDPSVLGRLVTFNERQVEIVGVLPASFRLPRFQDLMPIDSLSGQAQFFEPLTWTESQVRSVGAFDLLAFLRLPPDATTAQATADLNALLDDPFAGASFQPRARLRPLLDQVIDAARRPLWLLLASVAAVLLVAVVNLSNLFGARWLERRRDVALRRAVGAPPHDAILLVLRESVALALAGGLGGVLVAHVTLRALLASMPSDLPRLDEVTLDGSVLAMTAGVTLACGGLCALVPAWRARHADPLETLKTENAAARRQGAAPGALVVVEVALGVVLAVITGLLLASFSRVLNVDRGFDVDDLLAADVQLPLQRYPQPDDRARFYAEVLRELRSTSGIRAAGLVQRLPLEGTAFVDTLARYDDERPTPERPVANYRIVDPDYLRTMGIVLTRGRMFTEEDRERRPIVVSGHTARTLWPGENPIGRLTRGGGGDRPREVVGVAANARIVALERDAGPLGYVPYWENPPASATLVVRTATAPTAMTAAVNAAVRRLDPAMAVHNVRSMNGVLDAAVAMRRFQFLLTGAFAVAGMLLVGLGVFGVVATAVERRRTEIAIRLALGGGARRVLAMVLRQGMRPVAIGIILGLAASAAAGRAVAALLYEVSPHDGTVLAAGALVIATVAAGACLAPGVRAVRAPTTMLLKSD